MPPGRKGARNKKTEASAVPQSPPPPPPPPPQPSKPLSNPAPAARLSRTTRTSSKDIQPREDLPAEQLKEPKQREVTPQPPIKPIPMDVPEVAERVQDVEEEESEEDEGGVELLDGSGSDSDSFDTRSMSASTSGTQLEADALDPTLAIEAIPALHRKSQDILEFLLASKPAQLLKKVRQPGSSAGKRLDMTTKDFSVTKDLFAASTEFIRVNVVNQLLDTDIFAPLICKANFAALALGLVRTIGLSNDAVQYLMGLENYFPGAFFPSPGDWEEDVSAQVNRLMLEIRTQLFIAAVYYEQTIPFDDLLRQIFLEQEPDLDSNEDEELHEAWAMGCKPKGWDSLTKEERRNCKSRINRIRSAYIVVDGGNDRLEPLDIEYLVQHWPWDKFVEDMMKFIVQTTAAMDAESSFADLLDMAEQARKRGLQSQEEEEDGLDNEIVFLGEDTDAANDSNWLTDQSRTLVDPEMTGESQAEGGGNNRRNPRRSGDRLSSSAQLKFLKRQKMLLEAPNSPPAIKKTPSQKPKIVTSKAGMKALKSLAQSTANEAVAPASSAPPPPPLPPAATQGKARSRARANTNGPIPVQQTTASAANEPPNFDVGIDDIPIPAGTADQAALFKQLNAKRDKENRGRPPPKRSIYERQADAQKLSFNEDEELRETQSGDERAKARGQKGRKRSRDEVEEEAGEDPYAHDDRPEDPLRTKRSRVNPPAAPATREKPPTGAHPGVILAKQRVARPERRRQLPAEVAPPPVRQQSVEGRELVPHRNRQVSPEATPRAVRRQRSGSALAPLPPRDLARRRSHDDVLDQIHGQLTGERIRYIAARNRQRAIEKRHQVRQPWSQDEEDKLVEMVGLYGCQWSLIEQVASDVFAARGQVALKDKARNMKFSLLKSRMPLPPKFENVTMSRRLLQELEQMGIDPKPPRAIQEAEYQSTDSESEEHRVIDRRHLARIREGREEA